MQDKLKILALGIMMATPAIASAEVTQTCFATGMNLHGNTGVSYYHKTDVAGQSKNYRINWMFSFGAGYRANFGHNQANDQQAWLWLARLDFNYYGIWKKDNTDHSLFGFSALGGLGRQFNKRVSLDAITGLSIIRATSTQVRPTIGAQADYAFAGNLSADLQYLHTFDIMKGINTISVGLSYYW